MKMFSGSISMKSNMDCSQKVRIEFSLGPIIHLPNKYKTLIQKKINILMIIAALLKQTRYNKLMFSYRWMDQEFTNRSNSPWILRINSFHNEILCNCKKGKKTQFVTWMKLKTIKLSNVEIKRQKKKNR